MSEIMVNKKHLTSKQMQSLNLKEAQGQLSVLAVGIDAYDKASGFPALKTCSNDATEVRNAFQDVWQLNAEKDRIWLLKSGSPPFPSRGEIIKAIKHLATMTEPNDRLLFYYSGHGHRINDKSGAEKFI